MSPDMVLITGASSDIGLTLANRLITSGDAIVLAHYHSSPDRIERLAKSLAQSRIHPIPADFTSIESVEAMIQQVIEKYGIPNKIIHLPALKLRYERFTKFNLDHFNKDMTIQIGAAVAILRRVLPSMIKMPRAKIVFVLSSVTRGVPPKFMSMYTTVKQAQLGLMRSLASEYSSTGVCINAVSPSMVDTRFLGDIPDLVKQMSMSAAPRGRIATPMDVVGAIEYLLSDASDFITGIELPVTGGSVF